MAKVRLYRAIPTRWRRSDRLRMLLGRRLPVLVVSSMGRAGSTMVYDALVEGMTRKHFGSLVGSLVPARNSFVGRTAWDLSTTTLIGGTVYKTHDHPDSVAPERPAKFVFTFCAASDSVVSVHLCSQRYGREWTESHLEHMGADGPFEDIFERDVLRLAEQVEKWSSATHLDVLAIRYEALWNHVDILSEFVGFPVSLPPFRGRRAANADPRIVHRARALYREVDSAIAALPDVFYPPLGRPSPPSEASQSAMCTPGRMSGRKATGKTLSRRSASR